MYMSPSRSFWTRRFLKDFVVSKRVTLHRFCSLSLSLSLSGKNALTIPTSKLKIYDMRENESNFTGATEGGSFQINQKNKLLYF